MVIIEKLYCTFTFIFSCSLKSSAKADMVGSNILKSNSTSSFSTMLINSFTENIKLNTLKKYLLVCDNQNQSSERPVRSESFTNVVYLYNQWNYFQHGCINKNLQLSHLLACFCPFLLLLMWSEILLSLLRIFGRCTLLRGVVIGTLVTDSLSDELTGSIICLKIQIILLSMQIQWDIRYYGKWPVWKNDLIYNHVPYFHGIYNSMISDIYNLKRHLDIPAWNLVFYKIWHN